MRSDLSPASDELTELCSRACRERARHHGHTVSFSPKVFIPLTRLCRDYCGYCVFRRQPSPEVSPFMSPEEVLQTARAGEQAGCREALFVLGERPEARYPEARRWLARRGYDCSVHYLRDMCALVLRETRLYPHSNPGTLTRGELEALKPVNASMGLMLETSSPRLGLPGGPHEKAPSKRPAVRLRTLELAGELRIPMTTGLLIGIGETRQERLESLREIRRLQERFGHIQEVILQNFRAKPDSPMRDSAEARRAEMIEAAAWAREILGGRMNIQVPPNLNQSYADFLDAGINDWGGVSPVTPDFVNPEAAWPHLAALREQTRRKGFQLRARFPVYPEFILEPGWLDADVRRRLLADADGQGFVPEAPGGEALP